MADQPELETIQHPVLGPLKFPKDMGPDERNESIQRALLASGKAPPPGPTPPKINMQPSMLGSAASMGPEAIAQGRESAGRAFPGIHGPTKFNEKGLPAYQRPTVAEDASNAALVGSTLTAPLTGGMGLLPRLGLMGAGAAAGSAGSQLARKGEINPTQTAGDITAYGVVPELAGSAGLGLLKNGGRIGRAALAGGEAAAGRIPFVGPPIRAGLRAASREWSQFPVERAITRGMVPEYAGEGEEEGVRALGAPRAARTSEEYPAPTLPGMKPSGRLVLTPAQAQQEAQQMMVRRRLASQRGMQYAAGERPNPPGAR